MEILLGSYMEICIENLWLFSFKFPMQKSFYFLISCSFVTSESIKIVQKILLAKVPRAEKVARFTLVTFTFYSHFKLIQFNRWNYQYLWKLEWFLVKYIKARLVLFPFFVYLFCVHPVFNFAISFINIIENFYSII